MYISILLLKFSQQKACVLFIVSQGVAALHKNSNLSHLNLSECGELTDTGVEVSLRVCVLQGMHVHMYYLRRCVNT